MGKIGDRSDEGPWKWQLINLLHSIDDRLELLVKESAQKANRSKAGRASAEARRKKFGDARPSINRLHDVSDGKLNITLLETKSPAIDLLGEPVREQKKKRVREQKPTDGSLIWQSYEKAYLLRYGVPPLRNAKNNRHCSDIAKQVGPEVGCRLADYYVQNNDQFYVKASHPIGLCLLHLQKLSTEHQTGKMVTNTDARRIENDSQNDRAIRQYLEQQSVREQDSVKEVENAAS